MSAGRRWYSKLAEFFYRVWPDYKSGKLSEHDAYKEAYAWYGRYRMQLTDMMKEINQAVQKSGPIYQFAESEYWPVLKHLLGEMLVDLAKANLSLGTPEQVKLCNSANFKFVKSLITVIEQVHDKHEVHEFMRDVMRRARDTYESNLQRGEEDGSESHEETF